MPDQKHTLSLRLDFELAQRLFLAVHVCRDNSSDVIRAALDAHLTALDAHLTALEADPALRRRYEAARALHADELLDKDTPPRPS